MSRIVLLALVCSAALAAAQYSTPSSSSCSIGEIYDECPNSCYEPVCGDNGMQLCAGLLSCDPPKCVCDRSTDYARDPSSGKCVKRDQCPSWTLNPCMTVKCSSGMVCEAKNGKAGCVKAPSVEPYPVTLNACAATLCQVGSVCVEEGGVARCVAPSGNGNNNCTRKFEEWKQCATCEATCENKTPFCNRMCQPARCMCRQGFFRNKEGECVTENDCDVAAMTPSPSSCKRANEEYRECASACEPTCRDKDQERMCIAMCKPPACQCKVGFFRSDNGECVTRNQCPSRDPSVTPRPSNPQCKKNEGFSSCSSMCEPQCGQYEPIACILMCGPPKCQCTSGFYRNSNGECMTRAECEKSPSQPACKKNQIFQNCSSMCIPKCGEYEVRPCMAMCGAPKCQCDQGFYLDNHGECVTRQECEAQSSTPKTPSQSDCNPNEIFRECSSMCEEKCGETLSRACPASCGPPKCQCDDGFLRNSVGDCVSKTDCETDVSITCANIDCVSGFICEMKDGKPICKAGNAVTCDKLDCDVGHHCEILDGFPQCIADITCANIDCRSGMICQMKNGEPTCVNKEVLTCNTVKCAGGNRCEITPEGTPKCIPSITCANVRCAGPCRDSPSGPQCGPRPLILPISVGPTATPGCPINEEIRSCTNKCNEPFCGDENFARRCSLVCLTPQCECMEGFVRDGEKGCVQREECTKEGGKGDEALSPCSRKNCGIAGRCVEERGKAKCIPLFPATHKSMSPSTAASPPPSPSSSSRSFPSLPDSCDQVKCLNGGYCVMEEVKCISGPCKPVPKCKGGPSTVSSPSVDDHVPSTGFGSVYQPFAQNCGQLKCQTGEECTMERIPCFAPPCKKMAVCRPSNKICHKDHEVWDQCFHGCGETCQNRNPSCTEQCGPGGCICDTLYIRDHDSGECVRLEDCPASSSTRAIPIEKLRVLTMNSFSSYASPSYDSPIGSLPPQTCDGFDCPVGQMCTLPPMACPVPPCTRRPTCISDPNFLPGDEIIPTCEGHQCPAGQRCQLQQVQCIRAPCNPIPECVLDMGVPSCVLPCPLGMSCVLETVFCKKAPCPQKPSCRLLQVDPIPQTCAAVSCQFGETCVIEPLPCLVAPCPNRAICRPSRKKCAKKNEVWDQCFHGCESTCQTRNKMCTMQCGPGGCQCDSGFIRDEKSGDCIVERDCPRDGTKSCVGVRCRRDAQCEIRRGVPVCIRRTSTVIPTPIECAVNEEYDKCFHGCDATCDQPNPFCTKQCGPGGCKCANGFVRDKETKRCISKDDCTQRTNGY